MDQPSTLFLVSFIPYAHYFLPKQIVLVPCIIQGRKVAIQAIPSSPSVEQWPIERLIECPRNPRKDDDASDRMCGSIRESFKVKAFHLMLNRSVTLPEETV
jgi:hypothetical protein